MRKTITLLCVFFSITFLLSIDQLSSAEPATDSTNVSIAGTDEHEIVINEPPANWDPVLASDEELQKYAYPARPKDHAELEEWKKNVQGKKWFRPKFQRTNKIKRSLFEESHKNSTYTNGYQWSGVISYQTVQARATGFWRQPVATADSSHRPAYSSQWIGLGGANESMLVQAGTESDIMSNGSTDYSVWYEILGTNVDSSEMVITNFPHSPGDTYYLDISWVKGSPGHVNFYYSDSSNNYTTSFSVNNVTNNGNLSTSEWIFERFTVNNSLAPNLTKPDVGYVHFSQAKSASTPTGTPSLLSGTATSTDYRTIKSTDNLRTLASPGTVNSTGDFSVTWYNYN